MRTGFIFMALAAIAVPTACATPAQTREAKSQANPALIVLDAHNSERARFGLAPLAWSDELALEAAGWARKLARERAIYHSTFQQRDGAGENLWRGTRGAYDLDFMIGTFIDERRLFRAGAFPNVTRTDRWEDVGHYTQIIWPDTRQVGCAMMAGPFNDYLVCRYWPAGNVDGVRVGYRAN